MFPLLCAALLWGVTNPFLKRHSGVSNQDRRAAPRCGGCSLLVELYASITRAAFVAPFVANQLGSVAFTYALGTMELSIAVPVANAMTFVITAVTAALIGEAGGVPRSRECCALASIARFEVPLLTLFLLLPSLCRSAAWRRVHPSRGVPLPAQLARVRV